MYDYFILSIILWQSESTSSWHPDEASLQLQAAKRFQAHPLLETAIVSKNQQTSIVNCNKPSGLAPRLFLRSHLPAVVSWIYYCINNCTLDSRLYIHLSSAYVSFRTVYAPKLSCSNKVGCSNKVVNNCNTLW